ncbi:MAG TPA: hypothetical protein VHU84_08620 [Lacipirellulaceae bacterium]|nr:hypothetical protein [Lacipirellulaceae bacterium]
MLFAIVSLSLFGRYAGAKERNEFIVSYWCGPPSGGDYEAQYAEVAECNFTHAMFPNNGASPEQNKSILAACEKHGLKYLPYDGRVLQYQPNDPKFAANLDSMIADYAKSPAMAGYFMADEPGPGSFEFLGAVNRYLLKKDPQRLPFINLYPNYVDEKAIGMKYEDYVDKFCSTVKPKLLCYDHYALFDGVERDSYFANMEIIRRNALKYDAAMGFIFLCTPHGTYRDPTDTDLRWQVNTAIAYGCKALLYFTYFTPTDPAANFHDGILDANGKRTAHYEMAKSINGELKKLGGTLVHLKSTGVFHSGKLPAGCTALPKDAPIHPKEDVPLIVGLFQHDDGSRWAIVVNRDLHEEKSVALEMGPQVENIQQLSPQTGELGPVSLVNRAITLKLPAGGIEIFRLGS